MKKLILFTAILCASSFSYAETTDSAQKAEHIKMHEAMMKAHEQAANCLKSGKSEDECRKAFQEMCKESGGPERCGMGMMHHKRGK